MKSAILITARLKSTRLPKKIIKNIQGKPMIKHMIDRLKLAKIPKNIIICTSTIDQDDELEKIAHEENILCFRGSPEDVLLRLTNAARKFKIETVINCTADNPFVDPFYIDKLYNYHIKEKNDFTKIEGLPWGVFSYAISLDALEKACSIKEEKDTEVWHGYFTETNKFKWGVLEVSNPSHHWPELRLTVDLPEDFKMINTIFNELYDGHNIFPLKSILDLCRNKPDIQKINSEIKQKVAIPIKYKNS